MIEIFENCQIAGVKKISRSACIKRQWAAKVYMPQSVKVAMKKRKQQGLGGNLKMEFDAMIACWYFPCPNCSLSMENLIEEHKPYYEVVPTRYKENFKRRFLGRRFANLTSLPYSREA